MIKDITSYLSQKGYIFSSFENIEPKELNSRKKVKIYSACDIKNRYISIFMINQKSRFLIKNTQDIFQLQQKLVNKQEHNFKQNIILISSPICSKAIAEFKKNSWKVYDNFM